MKKTSHKRAPKRTAPTPLLNPKTPVDWSILFKLNSEEERGDIKPPGMTGQFDIKGWKRPLYEKNNKKFSHHYLFASSRNPVVQHGRSILGASPYDPLGSTFAEIYFGSWYYVVWNDQFYGDPMNSRGSPWGHSKGVLAWNEEGEGIVMQVSTPSWPGSGSKKFPRKTDGNTLGFVSDDDIQVSQHFYTLKLTKPDLIKVLAGMHNASVVTDPTNPQIVNNGGPPEVRALVKTLGRRDKDNLCTNVLLSSGVRLISKPSALAVPPWQLVSAELGGVDLRVASWWTSPRIYSTTRKSPLPGCWGDLRKPGAVDIATSGTWWEKKGHKVERLGLTGGPSGNHNHAKFGVSTSKGKYYSIFGDMNQQGALCPGDARVNQKCSSSQNGRGGLFYVMEDKTLHKSLTSLLSGNSAPTIRPPAKSSPKKKG